MSPIVSVPMNQASVEGRVGRSVLGGAGLAEHRLAGQVGGSSRPRGDHGPHQRSQLVDGRRGQSSCGWLGWGVKGSVIRVGGCQDPLSTAAATNAIPSAAVEDAALPDHVRRLFDRAGRRWGLPTVGGERKLPSRSETELPRGGGQIAPRQTPGQRDERGVARLREVVNKARCGRGFPVEVGEGLTVDGDRGRARHGAVGIKTVRQQRRGRDSDWETHRRHSRPASRRARRPA